MIANPSPKSALDFMMGPLAPFMNDPDVWEVRINKYQQVVCETNKGRVFHDCDGITPQYLERLTGALINKNKLSGIQPVNDVLLADGSRGIICLPPATVDGTVAVAFRKHLPVDKSLEDLHTEGRFTGWKRKHRVVPVLEAWETELQDYLEKDDLVSFFRHAVRRKLNIVVAGATGSGKSTFTRTLLREVPIDERIVVAEDVHEVSSALHREMVYLLYGNKKGRLTAAQCLRACMRLSPDRIMMTELRDEAALDYINSLNTGHPGGITSTHADNAETTLSRIAQLIKETEVGRTMDYEQIMKKLHSTIDVVVYMERRQVKEVLYDPLFKKQQLAA